MDLEHIIKMLNLTVLTDAKDFADITPQGGYTSDLLSCVMAGAKQKNLWITLQAHNNIVAVAALLDLSAVIITEGATPEPETIERANQEGIILLSTPDPTYQVIGQLWDLGIRPN
ncbi:MAG: serine kinase [Chloroflexi bacterium]|nr:serine kinase [Chloroflexota bacterium]